MITIKELSIDTESAGKIIDLIKKHEPEIWNVLKDELKKAFSLHGVVASLKEKEPLEYGLWREREGYTLCSDTVYRKGKELITVGDLLKKYNDYWNKF